MYVWLLEIILFCTLSLNVSLYQCYCYIIVQIETMLKKAIFAQEVFNF